MNQTKMQSVEGGAAPGEEDSSRPGPRWLPLLAALFFGCWALRGIETGGIVWTDAARHAMNGALIHDWLREGPWLAPGDYARWYYAHWPALSLGYHPPVFPVIEAFAFLVIGVGSFAARLVVALATGISVLLLYRLVLTTHKSPAIALLSAVGFFALPLTQSLAQHVMLEMPALVFVLLALLALPRQDEPFTAWRGFVFVLFTATAIWTKQLSVFLGAIPVVAAVFAGRREWLRSRALWGSVVSCGVAFLALTVFELAFGPASPRRFAVFRGFPRVLASNSQVYLEALFATRSLAVLTALVVLAAIAMVHRRRWREFLAPDSLYWAWLVSVMAALMLGEWNSPRYLFFAYPALVTLAVVAFHRFLSCALSPQRVAAVLTAATAAMCILALNSIPPRLTGPAEAARLVAADHPTRVLYAGESDGHFTFELRSATGNTDAVVIRGERLPRVIYSSAAFEDFAARYAVSHVVLEEIERFGIMPWTRLIADPALSMLPLNQVPVSGYRSGTLHLYRFTAGAPETLDVLRLPSDKMGLRSMELDWKKPSWRTPGGSRP
jgi:4-amino-4-deoxy-L-arabinose transferase-like glycosyltransferase